MKTFDELVKEFRGTPLQQDERRKKLVGEEIQIVGELGTIAPNYISFYHLLRSGIAIHVNHEGEQFRKQLLEYTDGDSVRVTARFTNISHDNFEGKTTYEFTLISIVRLKTREAREKEEQAAKEKNESNCFIATAAYGAPNTTVFLLQKYRDYILSKTIVGRAVVGFYYLMSPPLAKFIEASYRRKSITRVLLRPVVFVARRQLESFRKRERLRA